ncbi:MAG: hypothetical protein J3K34DRAFT_424615 [Monoraphidium minutum]|nr:MAG: hypothetical protein J3K34DRAFT_424615 [Monoraphidium minutum]
MSCSYALRPGQAPLPGCPGSSAAAPASAPRLAVSPNTRHAFVRGPQHLAAATTGAPAHSGARRCVAPPPAPTRTPALRHRNHLGGRLPPVAAQCGPGGPARAARARDRTARQPPGPGAPFCLAASPGTCQSPLPGPPHPPPPRPRPLPGHRAPRASGSSPKAAPRAVLPRTVVITSGTRSHRIASR